MNKDFITLEESKESKFTPVIFVKPANIRSHEFISSFVELGSFVGVGKKYGVSDNALKKWCKHYNIPENKKDLIEYINRGIGNG